MTWGYNGPCTALIFHKEEGLPAGPQLSGLKGQRIGSCVEGYGQLWEGLCGLSGCRALTFMPRPNEPLVSSLKYVIGLLASEPGMVVLLSALRSKSSSGTEWS